MPRSSVAPPATFGDYVRRLAAERGLETTNAAIARAAGIDQSALSRWLTEQNRPSVEGLRQLSTVLGVRLGDLMVAAGMATPTELGMSGAPPQPLPPPVGRIMKHLRRDDVTDRQKRGLLLITDRSTDIWEEALEVEVEPRMRRR